MSQDRGTQRGAFPIRFLIEDGQLLPDGTPAKHATTFVQLGLSERDYMAIHLNPGTLSDLHAEALVGRSAPSFTSGRSVTAYMVFRAEAEARWRFMLADSMLRVRDQ